jgi:hypothetical protein
MTPTVALDTSVLAELPAELKAEIARRAGVRRE